MKLVISGTTPSKKNSRINTRSGRSFPSKRFTDWEKPALNELVGQTLQMIENPSPIKMVFYNADNRRHDLDNQASSILDTLVKAGVIEDDNQKYVDDLHLVYGGVDKENPRCVVYIAEN